MRRQLLAAVLAALLFAPAGEAWTWPAAGAVLQPFLFDPAHPYAAGQHRGVDVGGEPGAAVLAPAAGSVTFAGTVPSSGKSVTITTADGYAVTLTHLGAIAVARDAAVAEGDVIGAIGPSGDSEVAQPYVHLGIRTAADAQGYLDPLTFLPARVSAPAGLVPPVVVDPPAASVPVPASSADPAPIAEPAASAEAAPEPVTVPAAQPVAEALPAEQAPAGPEPAAAAQPPVSAAAPVAPPVAAAEPVHGAAGVLVRPTAERPREIARADAPHHASGATASKERALGARATKRAFTPAVADPTAADAAGRPQALPVSQVHAAARMLPATGATRAAEAPRLEPHRAGPAVPALAAGALLATVLLTGALGAVRMMVRCGRDTEEDPGRSGVAVCGGSPPPWSRGGLRRPVGRVRPLSPARRERRPHGEWHGRARHAGDGRRR